MEVPAVVRDEFGLEVVFAPVRPTGADAENFPAVTTSGVRVVVRAELFAGRPVGLAAGFCDGLAAKGLPVPAPLRSAAGGFVVGCGSLAWSCWEMVDGAGVVPDVSSARELGALVARIHASGVVTDPDRLVGCRLPSLWRWMGLLSERDRVLLAGAGGPVGFCHTDQHPGNVLRAGGRIVLIDWLDAGVGPLSVDVAVAAAYWAAELGPDGARAVLAGYRNAGGPASVVGTQVVAAARLLFARDGGEGRFVGSRLGELLGRGTVVH